MADVQFLSGALVVASVAKATDAAARDLGPVAVAVWLLAAALLMIRYRVGALLLAAVAFSAALFWDDATNHVVFIGWMALIVGLLPERDSRSVLKYLVCALYFFATAHKLIGGNFLTGMAFAHHVTWTPLPLPTLAWAAICLQIFLVVAVWRESRYAIPAALVLHAPIVFIMASALPYFLQLLAFNTLSLAAVLYICNPAGQARDKEAAQSGG